MVKVRPLLFFKKDAGKARPESRCVNFPPPSFITQTRLASMWGKSIPKAKLEALMADHQSLLERESADNLAGNTEFEIITAIAYDYFASEQVDVAIMEVGMVVFG